MAVKKDNVTFRIDHRLKEILEATTKEESRSFSNQINVVLEEWAKIKDEIHPQFIRDIKESLASGKPEPVWEGI